MARPALGPPISFRLPADLHKIAVERADRAGQSVNDYMRDRYVEALGRQQIREAARANLGKGHVEPKWKAKAKR